MYFFNVLNMRVCTLVFRNILVSTGDVDAKKIVIRVDYMYIVN